MSKSKIGTAEAIMLILTIVVTHALLSLPSNLLSITGSATIINLIYITIIVIFIAYIIYRLFKNFPRFRYH